MSSEPSCVQLVELLTDYMEGELSEGDQALVEQHVATCPPCAEVLAQLRVVTSLAGRLDEAHVEGLSVEQRGVLVDMFRRVR